MIVGNYYLPLNLVLWTSDLLSDSRNSSWHGGDGLNFEGYPHPEAAHLYRCFRYWGGTVPVMVWSVSATLYRLLRSCALELFYQAMIQPITILSAVYPPKLVIVHGDFQRKLRHWYVFCDCSTIWNLSHITYNIIFSSFV